MGIRGDLIGLMHLAMPDEAHWMTSVELSDTGLATERMASEDYIGAIDHPISAMGSLPPASGTCIAPVKSLPPFTRQLKVRVEMPIQHTAAASMLIKEASNVGFPVSKQYLSYGVTVVTTLTGTPIETFVAVVPPGAQIETGDIVTVLTRHINPFSPCSFIPNLIVSPTQTQTAESELSIPPEKYTPPASVVCASPPKSLPQSAEEIQARVELPIRMADTPWMLSKEAANVGYPLNQQYLGYGVTVVTTLTGTPPQTLVAVAPPGISVQVGDIITLQPRHRDANAACSFTPNLILPGHHS